jgi:hypothetical protein
MLENSKRTYRVMINKPYKKNQNIPDTNDIDTNDIDFLGREK